MVCVVCGVWCVCVCVCARVCVCVCERKRERVRTATTRHKAATRKERPTRKDFESFAVEIMKEKLDSSAPVP